MITTVLLLQDAGQESGKWVDSGFIFPSEGDDSGSSENA